MLVTAQNHTHTHTTREEKIRDRTRRMVPGEGRKREEEGDEEQRRRKRILTGRDERKVGNNTKPHTPQYQELDILQVTLP